jgi:hypothetical protein
MDTEMEKYPPFPKSNLELAVLDVKMQIRMLEAV